MKEYIDRDLMLKQAGNLPIPLNLEEVRLLRRVIRTIPEADVRENVHGEWVDAEDSELNYYYSVCSQCGSCLQIEKKYRNFCPNCGAIME